MDKPTVIVTGAGGFIGSSLVGRLAERGWAVRALARRAPAERIAGVGYFPYEISGEPPAAAFAGASHLVHAAYVRQADVRDSDQVNLGGAGRLLDLCRRTGVRPIFLSSFSAEAGAKSHYGRTKAAIEGLLEPGDLILRPGLVLGRGGLFGSLARLVSRRRVIPLLGRGDQALQTVEVDDLCEVIAQGVGLGVRGTRWIAHPKPILFRAMLEEMAAQEGRRLTFVPVPPWLPLAACRLAEALGIRLPVGSDNLLGLLRARVVDTASDLADFGVAVKSPEESLRRLGRRGPGRAAEGAAP